MNLAEAVKDMSSCTRRQVGAVITNSDHEIISTGYNGTPRGMLNCNEGGCPRGQLSYAQQPAYGSYEGATCVHAEKNAIKTAQDRGIDLTNTTIHVTHDPCDNCAASIVEAGITRVISPNS